MLYNQNNLPTVTLQLRNLDNRHYHELKAALVDATQPVRADTLESCRPLSGFSFVILSLAEQRALLFNVHSLDKDITPFIDTPHELQLLRATGIVFNSPDNKENGIIATKPIPSGPEWNLLMGRFPFLYNLEPATATTKEI